ncbi:hypothetical protein HNV10_12845 [Winogradskyella litoriviva]|uniref:Por secretion system C-terminal sorting domain-containing protein n=1 Tax=Winogradskyella litoriviva TaxID=1220182 RepID=A0ABX2E6Q4_9FLAO|nr:hypothetical protein [Winogradskyella litoriviva]NRD24140.1 hypothetical protein [Winogradskyella litoriviva]
MKNILKNSLVIVVLFTSLFTNAHSTLRMSKDATKTILTLTNVNEGNELSVKDAFGLTLYSEMIENTGDYIKGFDLTELPDGNYHFELSQDLILKTIPFSVEENKIKFQKENEVTVFKPFVKLNDNVVSISKLTLNKKAVKIEIYFDNEGYSLLHSETIEGTQDIKRMFKLTKKGNYKIVTRSEGKTFVEYVSI